MVLDKTPHGTGQDSPRFKALSANNNYVGLFSAMVRRARVRGARVRGAMVRRMA